MVGVSLDTRFGERRGLAAAANARLGERRGWQRRRTQREVSAVGGSGGERSANSAAAG